MAGSRWVRTDVTFGPTGRIVMTVLLLVPLWWSARTTPVGFIIYGVFILPWALRDTWKRVRFQGDPHDVVLQRRLQAELRRDEQDWERPPPPKRW